MSEDRFLFLVTRHLAGEIMAEEQRELDALLLQPGFASRFAMLKRFWQNREVSPDVEKALSTVMTAIRPTEEETVSVREVVRPRRKLWLTIPAAAIIIVSLVLFTNRRADKVSPGTLGTTSSAVPVAGVLEKQNLKGTRSLITLPDGSSVWLNADSRLRYPVAFTGDTREVELTGEAFFDVVKNKQKPFIIHLDNGTVRVLGTSFNVKAYKGEKVVETSVVTGKVAFIPRTGKTDDTTFLTPDLKAIYTIETGVVETTSTIGVEEKAWTQGKLIFRDQSMADIASVLERVFGKELVFNKDEIMDYRLTGSFENNSLEEILYFLSRIRPFTYRITETQVLLYGLE